MTNNRKSKNISILGSTGSIGQNTLELARRHPDMFNITALAAGRNFSLLAKQCLEFDPELISISSDKLVPELKMELPENLHSRIMTGQEGACATASHKTTDIVVSAMVGFSGLRATLAAIEARKTIALANKEVLVTAGHLVMPLAEKYGAKILPVDSEHSAIFQCLENVHNREKNLKRIILTASGGPFLETKKEEFKNITPQQALKHPRWKMGPKITIDSATMMNKGLEIIEARWLFDIDAARIDIIIHPQSIVHSMIEFQDGSMLAQLGVTDMKGPISYALSHPERLPEALESLDLGEIASLTFRKAEPDKFICLNLARSALNQGGNLPTLLNAANEVAVEAFLAEKLSFDRIPHIIESTMNKLCDSKLPTLDSIFDIDNEARHVAAKLLLS